MPKGCDWRLVDISEGIFIEIRNSQIARGHIIIWGIRPDKWHKYFRVAGWHHSRQTAGRNIIVFFRVPLNLVIIAEGVAIPAPVVPNNTCHPPRTELHHHTEQRIQDGAIVVFNLIRSEGVGVGLNQQIDGWCTLYQGAEGVLGSESLVLVDFDWKLESFGESGLGVDEMETEVHLVAPFEGLDVGAVGALELLIGACDCKQSHDN